MFIINKCRRISYEVFVLIFVHDCLIFWRQKMGAVNEETSRTKGRKSDTKSKKKKNKHFFYYFIVLSKNYFLYCNYVGVKYLKKDIFLAYHTTSFSLQNLLMMSKLHVRVLKINSLLNTWIFTTRFKEKKNFLRVKLNFF